MRLSGIPLLLSLLGASLGVLAAGCSTVRLSREARRSLGPVSLRERVDVELSFSGELPGTHVETRGAPWYGYLVTAPVGIAFDIADWSENRERRTRRFAAQLREAEVDVAAVVRGEFTRALEEAGLFVPLVPSAQARAQFQLAAHFGLADGLGVRGSWKPYLTVEGLLVERSGRVLWRRSVSVSEGDERLPELDRPLARPELLRSACAAAARLVAQDLVADLKA